MKISFDKLENQLKNVPVYTHPRRRKAMWEKHILGNTIEGGSILEFGVASGGSLGWFTRNFQDTPVYGFDSFFGLPEDWKLGKQILRKGHFSTNGKTPANIKEAIYVEGLFEDTIPEFIKVFDDYIKILHLDCDLYNSAKIVLENFYKFFKVGTFILFDECTHPNQNHPQYNDMRLHEYKAFMEFCEANPSFDFETIARTDGPQLMIKVTNI